jgi:hypothetical protein
LEVARQQFQEIMQRDKAFYITTMERMQQNLEVSVEDRAKFQELVNARVNLLRLEQSQVLLEQHTQALQERIGALKRKVETDETLEKKLIQFLDKVEEKDK